MLEIVALDGTKNEVAKCQHFSDELNNLRVSSRCQEVMLILMLYSWRTQCRSGSRTWSRLKIYSWFLCHAFLRCVSTEAKSASKTKALAQLSWLHGVCATNQCHGDAWYAVTFFYFNRVSITLKYSAIPADSVQWPTQLNSGIRTRRHQQLLRTICKHAMSHKAESLCLLFEPLDVIRILGHEILVTVFFALKVRWKAVVLYWIRQ